MAVAVLVPKAGDSVTEGRIAQWFVADGAAVKADQPLFELETDKLTVPVPSPAAGVLKQLAKVGDVVAVPGSLVLVGSPVVEDMSPVPAVVGAVGEVVAVGDVVASLAALVLVGPALVLPPPLDPPVPVSPEPASPQPSTPTSTSPATRMPFCML